MIKVLFVCWGNICRSPMAEFILKDMIKEADLSAYFEIESAATSVEESGNPIYPSAREELKKHGIGCEGHRARQVRPEDYDKFNLIIGMEAIHLQIMRTGAFSRFGGDPMGKLHLLMEYSEHPGTEIEDPWYTGDFEGVYGQIREACKGLLTKLSEDL